MSGARFLLPILLPSLLILAVYAVIVTAYHADYERRCVGSGGHLAHVRGHTPLCLTNDGRVIELPA